MDRDNAAIPAGGMHPEIGSVVQIQAISHASSAHAPLGRCSPPKMVGPWPSLYLVGWSRSRPKVGNEVDALVCRQHRLKQVIGVPSDPSPITDNGTRIDADLHLRSGLSRQYMTV